MKALFSSRLFVAFLWFSALLLVLRKVGLLLVYDDMHVKKQEGERSPFYSFLRTNFERDGSNERVKEVEDSHRSNGGIEGR